VSDVIETEIGYSVHVKSREKIFHAKHLIVCAGPWAASLLRPLTLALPVTPMRSIYWITETCLEEKSTQPICVVPYVQGYFRPETNALLFGIRDQGAALHPGQVPNDVHGFEFPNAQDGMSALHESWQPLVHFWPNIEHLGLSTEVTGISSYSPDGLPVIGAPESFKKLTVVSGCSGAGIAYSGGIAKQAVNHALEDTLHQAFNFNRFDQGDAYDEAFRQRCLLARSQKKAG
jgi:4-methylaminobutanoate oxidase (formaldehyde-forming)